MLGLLDRSVTARGGSVQIAKVSALDADPPHRLKARVEHPDGTMELVIQESCWAQSFRPASFGEMRAWTIVAGLRSLRAMAHVGWGGVRSSDHWLSGREDSILRAVAAMLERHGLSPGLTNAILKVSSWSFQQARPLLQLLRLAVYVSGLLILLAIGLAALLLPLVVVALVVGTLWKVTKRLTSGARSGIAASLGDAFTFERRVIERAAMAEQIRSDLRAIALEAPAATVVIAHSLGAAVTYEALRGLEAAARPARLVTVGNALARSA
jgi:hypothetical protein